MFVVLCEWMCGCGDGDQFDCVYGCCIDYVWLVLYGFVDVECVVVIDYQFYYFVECFDGQVECDCGKFVGECMQFFDEFGQWKYYVYCQ